MERISGPLNLWTFPVLNAIIRMRSKREENKNEEKELKIETNVEEENANEETEIDEMNETNEITQKVEIDEDKEDERIFFIEQKDITKTTQFSPRPSDTHQDRLPIRGEGKLNNFLIVSESDNYDVTVYVDDRYVVDDSFTYLKSMSNELDHVSAYSSDGKHVVNVSKYPFVDELDMDIRAREQIKFDLVRVEGKYNG